MERKQIICEIDEHGTGSGTFHLPTVINVQLHVVQSAGSRLLRVCPHSQPQPPSRMSYIMFSQCRTIGYWIGFLHLYDSCHLCEPSLCFCSIATWLYYNTARTSMMRERLCCSTCFFVFSVLFALLCVRTRFCCLFLSGLSLQCVITRRAMIHCVLLSATTYYS